MNKGMIAKKGSINIGTQINSGDNNSNNFRMIQKECKAIMTEDVRIEEDTESIQDLLDELKLELSEYKYSLDELRNKVSIIDDNLESNNPNTEKITKNSIDLLARIHQATGIMSSLSNLIDKLQLHLT